MDRLRASSSVPGSTQVLVLSQRVPFPPNKGEKIRTYHQVRSMVDSGFDVTVCTLPDSKAEWQYLGMLERSLGVRTFGVDSGARWPRMFSAFLKGQPISVGVFYSAALMHVVGSLLERSRIDAILCTSSAMAEYVIRAGFGTQRDAISPLLIMDFMDVDSEKWLQYKERASFPKSWIYGREARLLRAYERDVYDLFDACLLVTQNELDLFRDITGVVGKKLHAIGNGVELGPTIERIGRPAGRANLLFTGAMDYFPNEDAMLWFHGTMWPQFRSRWPNATLTIAGMNPTRKLRAIGRQPGIDVTGFVEDISRYYADADVFVAPFRIARGIQNKILQSFAAGVPVVTTPEGAAGIDCSDSVDVSVAGEPDAFVDAVERLLNDPEQYERQRLAAYRLVASRYSWKAQTRLLQNIVTGTGAVRRRESTSGR